MKVNCNFLPLEYRAFMLEKRALAIWCILAVVSVGIFIYTYRRFSKDIQAFAKKISTVQTRQGAIKAEREQMQYPQDRIQKLIEQFSFIQKAMGAKDFPWLRFYQSIEDAIPVSDAGRRSAYLTRLAQGGERTWTMEGVVEDWKQATELETKMIASTYSPPGGQPRKNFGDVRLVNYRSLDGGKGYSFRIDFTFVDSF